MKHTPGPWGVGQNCTLGNCRGPLVTGNGYAVAFVGVGMEGEKQANAHLIAAAPELLEALRHALAPLGDRASGGRPVLPIKSAQSAFALAVAAIAKAEGRQP